MPQVNLKPETYAALERIAVEQGRPIEEAAEIAVGQFLCHQEMTEEQYQQAWDELLREARAGVPVGLTADQIERDIDQATSEAWAERRARGS